jgi:lycopene cyclase domain-containing protein
MKYTYLLVNFFSVIVPFLFSFHPKINFYKIWKAFFPANIIAAIIFLIWDVLFTSKGIWGFNPKYVSEIYFFHLPLEEVLFFICIPFACVFTYHSINLFFKIEWKLKTENIFCIILSLLLFITGILFYDRLYTSVTFISTAILMLVLKFIFKIKWFGKLISIYPILLIPFFIVNGILTGSCLQEPVVWYNNAENLGIRLFTIPVEDVFYGFELILLNIFFFEIFKSKSKHHHETDTQFI